MIEFRCADNKEEIKKIPSKSIDFIYFDPPFGITENVYDNKLDWDILWIEMWRVLKSKGVIAIHSSQPFTAHLISSQIKKYKYNWYWKKTGCSPTGFQFSKFQPMRQIEEICVFYKKGVYYPQMVKREKPYTHPGGALNSEYFGRFSTTTGGTYTHRFPTHIIEFRRVNHPYSTRPLELCEYFLKTYSLEGNTVLDLTCSNGQTAIACHRLNRNYIGVDISQSMIDDAKKNFEENTNNSYGGDTI